MAEMSLKQQKEDFVTGHSGTSPWELLLVCSSAPIGIWLYQHATTTSTHTWNKAILVEAMVILFPVALTQTNLLYPWALLVLSIELVLSSWISYRRWGKAAEAPRPEASSTMASSRLGFVTCYRSCVLYLTFVAILAVDFYLFPRRFAKTETRGYSLMDLGAGSFVVSAGLVSPKARMQQNKHAWKRTIPLVGMGMIRLFTNKAVEYQEHVSEYGIHWNFFFTLAAIAPVASSFSSLQGEWKSLQWAIPISMLAVYQWALSTQGLQDYVEEAPRSCSQPDKTLCNLFAANREGILGCISYAALYMLSEQVGRICLWTSHSNIGSKLTLTATSLWLLHCCLVLLGVPVSRRTTNASFCVWTLAHNILLLKMIHAAMASESKVPPILEAVNRHGLLVFLIANILTGLVNLSINTLETSDELAFVVVFLYLCLVGGFALLADRVLVPALQHAMTRRDKKNN